MFKFFKKLFMIKKIHIKSKYYQVLECNDRSTYFVYFDDILEPGLSEIRHELSPKCPKYTLLGAFGKIKLHCKNEDRRKIIYRELILDNIKKDNDSPSFNNLLVLFSYSDVKILLNYIFQLGGLNYED